MEQDYHIINTFSKFIEISGIDRTNFLQGLITNDIRKCDDNNPIYSCFLSPQGKFIADFFIINVKNHYLIEIHEKFFDSFYLKLKLYKLRSSVTFKENNDLISIIYYSKNYPIFKKNTISFKDPRKDNLGIKIYLDRLSNDFELIKKAKECKYEIYKKNLIKNIIPYSASDLIENKSLLLENNFQNINAIDWDKGCYIGQEITARMKYRSLLKKKIYVLELIKGNINLNSIIIVNDINIGYVISQVDKYLLCMLKINLVEKKYINKEIIEINQSTQIKFL